jgi:hypothetical protein
MISGCTNQPNIRDPLEQACIDSGGIVTTQTCCSSVSAFPNTCLIGACGCAPANSKNVQFCDCGVGMCFDGNSCVANNGPGIQVSSFEECVAAGYPVMESYPRQCQTPDGQNFVEEINDPMEKLCSDSGGNWNPCSSRCVLDNQGKEGVICTMMCEALCECGGIAGFSCPGGQNCIINSNVADALGYCEPAEVIGGQRAEYGCLGPAGYSWDENVSACLRPWELNEIQKEAAKIAVASLSYPVTVTQVDSANCIGCFDVYLQRNDNQDQLKVALVNWTMRFFQKITLSADERKAETQVCKSDSDNMLTINDALSIAASSECTQNGTLTDRHSCNSITGTWWIDLDIEKEGCSPACVVNVDTKNAEINWRCTGLLPQ